MVVELSRDPNTFDLFTTDNPTFINKTKIIPGIADHESTNNRKDKYPFTKQLIGVGLKNMQ